MSRAALPGDLGAGAGRGHDGRTAAGQRLQDRDAEALAQRCQHEAVGQLVGLVDALVRNEPQELNALQVGRGESARQQVFADVAAPRRPGEAAAATYAGTADKRAPGARCCRPDRAAAAGCPVCSTRATVKM